MCDVNVPLHLLESLKSVVSRKDRLKPLFFLSTSEAALACLAVDPAIMLMVVGVLMFIITFCGCVGSLRENICLLQTVSLQLLGRRTVEPLTV